MFWGDDTKIPDSEAESISPNGKYKLVINRHKTPGWDYSSAVLYSISKTGQQGVARVYRNYGHFPFCWHERGSQTYLFFGQHYEGYGVVNCDTGGRIDYLPPAGNRFCWASMESSENTLTVIGCAWGGPEERVEYDITNIFSVPYPARSGGLVDWEDEDDEALSEQEAPHPQAPSAS